MARRVSTGAVSGDHHLGADDSSESSSSEHEEPVDSVGQPPRVAGRLHSVSSDIGVATPLLDAAVRSMGSGRSSSTRHEPQPGQEVEDEVEDRDGESPSGQAPTSSDSSRGSKTSGGGPSSPARRRSKGRVSFQDQLPSGEGEEGEDRREVEQG